MAICEEGDVMPQTREDSIRATVVITQQQQQEEVSIERRDTEAPAGKGEMERENKQLAQKMSLESKEDEHEPVLVDHSLNTEPQLIGSHNDVPSTVASALPQPPPPYPLSMLMLPPPPPLVVFHQYPDGNNDEGEDVNELSLKAGPDHAHSHLHRQSQLSEGSSSSSSSAFGPYDYNHAAAVDYDELDDALMELNRQVQDLQILANSKGQTQQQAPLPPPPHPQPSLPDDITS